MKKIFAIILVVAMLFSLAACGKSEAPAATEPPVQTEAPVSPETDSQEPTGERTMGEILLGEFRNIIAGGVTNPQEIADSLIANPVIEFSAATAPMEEGYLAGFSEEIEGFEEAVMFGPAIGSIPFVGYIFRTADAGEAAELAETLAETADLRWNICVEADEMLIDQADELVFFVMCPAEA